MKSLSTSVAPLFIFCMLLFEDREIIFHVIHLLQFLRSRHNVVFFKIFCVLCLDGSPCLGLVVLGPQSHVCFLLPLARRRTVDVFGCSGRELSWLLEAPDGRCCFMSRPWEARNSGHRTSQSAKRNFGLETSPAG